VTPATTKNRFSKAVQIAESTPFDVGQAGLRHQIERRAFAGRKNFVLNVAIQQLQRIGGFVQQTTFAVQQSARFKPYRIGAVAHAQPKQGTDDGQREKKNFGMRNMRYCQ
jgi:hypothetical protein